MPVTAREGKDEGRDIFSSYKNLIVEEGLKQNKGKKEHDQSLRLREEQLLDEKRRIISGGENRGTAKNSDEGSERGLIWKEACRGREELEENLGTKEGKFH